MEKANERFKNIVSNIIIEDPYKLFGFSKDIVLDANVDERIKEAYDVKFKQLSSYIENIQKGYNINFSLEQLLGGEDYHFDLEKIYQEKATVQGISKIREEIEEARRSASERYLELIRLKKAYNMIKNANNRNKLLQLEVKDNLDRGLITKVEQRESKQFQRVKIKLDSGDEVKLIEDSKLEYTNFSKVNKAYIRKYRLYRDGKEEGYIYLNFPENLNNTTMENLKSLLSAGNTKEKISNFNGYLGTIRQEDINEATNSTIVFDPEEFTAITMWKSKERKENEKIK